MRYHRGRSVPPKLCSKESKARYKSQMKVECAEIKKSVKRQGRGQKKNVNHLHGLNRPKRSLTPPVRVSSKVQTGGQDDQSPRTHRHAQRKFASLCPMSPHSMPSHAKNDAPLLMPKADDFITFLCFRNTVHLPKALEIFRSPSEHNNWLSSDEDESSCGPQVGHYGEQVGAVSSTNMRSSSFCSRNATENVSINDDTSVSLSCEKDFSSTSCNSTSGTFRGVTPSGTAKRGTKKKRKRACLAGGVSSGVDQDLSDKNFSDDDLVPLSQVARSSRSDVLLDKTLETVHETVSIRVEAASSRSKSELTSVPCLTPAKKELDNFLAYVSQIEPSLESCGMCLISSRQELYAASVVHNQLSFKMKQQYIHRFRNRCPPISISLECMRMQLHEDILLEEPPSIMDCELDLLQILDFVKQIGGYQALSAGSDWCDVGRMLLLPKPGRYALKLEHVYLRFILPYDSLPDEEKRSALRTVTENASNIRDRPVEVQPNTKTTSVSKFQRIAYYAQLFFADGEERTEVLEKKFWDIVESGTRHVGALSAEVDCENSKIRAGWNFASLAMSPLSALKYLGKVTGVSKPCLKLESVYCTSGWRVAPHGLYYTEYVHSGADKIVYTVPGCTKLPFKQKLRKFAPEGVSGDDLEWLQTNLVAPSCFRSEGINVYRSVLKEGQFLVVKPNTLFCTVSCGYNLSEAVCFAPLPLLSAHFEMAMLSDVSKFDAVWSKIVLNVATSAIDSKDCSMSPSLIVALLQILKNDMSTSLKSMKSVGLTCVVIEKGSGKACRHHRKSPPSAEDIVPCCMCKRLCYLTKVGHENSKKVMCPSDAINKVQLDKSDVDKLQIFVPFDEAYLDSIITEVSALSGEE